MNWFTKLLKNGFLTERAADGLGILGVLITWATAYFFDKWEGFWFWILMCVGMVLGYTAAYGGLAKKFGFQPPFSNDPLGWRKAKESYKAEDQPTEPDPKASGKNSSAG